MEKVSRNAIASVQTTNQVGSVPWEIRDHHSSETSFCVGQYLRHQISPDLQWNGRLSCFQYQLNRSA